MTRTHSNDHFRMLPHWAPNLGLMLATLCACQGEPSDDPSTAAAKLEVETMYEAETGAPAGGARIQPATNASKGAVIGALNAEGASVTVRNVDGGAGGIGKLRLRYSNGYGAARSLAVYVNGTRVKQQSFEATTSWTSFAFTPPADVPLRAGPNNEVRIQRDADSVAAADIDAITITPPVSATAAKKYEAERGTLKNGARVQAAANASGDVVGAINDVGASVAIAGVDGGAGGNGTVKLRYSNGYPTARTLSLYVNGAKAQSVALPPTGSWFTFADSFEVPVTLAAGTANEIRVQRDATDNPAADIDYVVVSGRPSTTPAPTTPAPTTPPPTPPPPTGSTIKPTIAPLARTLNVAAGQSIAAAAAGARFGDRIVVAAGTFNEPQFTLPPGVSLVGSGVGSTVIRFADFTWWQGSIRLASEKTTAGQQMITDLTLDGQGARAFVGVEIHDRTDVLVQRVRITGFYEAGIEIKGSRNEKSAVIEIADFWIGETSREGNDGSRGNLMTSGNVDRLLVRDGKFETMSANPIGPSAGFSGSGYAFKARPYYEGSTMVPDPMLSNSRFTNNTWKCKSNASWNGGFSPNFSFEVWAVSADNVEIDKNTFGCFVSLEYNKNAPVARTFWLHDNLFKVATGPAVEFAIPNVLVERNVFDFTANTNAWSVFGEFNNGTRIRGQRVVDNVFELGTRAPSLFVYTAPVEDWRFERNTIRGSSAPTLMELRRANSNGSNNLTIVGNTFARTDWRPFSYLEGSNGQRPTNVTISP